MKATTGTLAASLAALALLLNACSAKQAEPPAPTALSKPAPKEAASGPAPTAPAEVASKSGEEVKRQLKDEKKPGTKETPQAAGAGSLENQFLIGGVTATREAPVASNYTDSRAAKSEGGTAASEPPKAPPPPPAKHPFTGLSVVNGKPFADMYFQHFGVNPTIETEEEPTSTFSVSTNTASYTLARSYLGRGVLPEPDAVRVEEFVNSFHYLYEAPDDGDAFAVHAEAFPSPNRKGYHVLHLGLKGRDVAKADRKSAHLVFVVDVSGSMNIENRLGLVKKALRLLVDELGRRDTVGLVVYGTNARTLLPPTSAADRGRILEAIETLRAEGSTNAQEGIREGYRMAAEHLVPGAVNRVVLCTDGVANNGVTDADGIFATVKDEAARGVTLSAVGFGMGNYNDVLLEKLARIGDGNYAYVDRLEEARRLFVKELTGTLQVIAKDAKIQVAFDPRSVARYRLLGYEARHLEKEEFDDDRVDAGEIGAGHAVTALYEVKLRPSRAPLGVVRIRHKEPEGGRSRLVEKTLRRSVVKESAEAASSPARLALAAASFAEKLRGSYWTRNLSYGELLALWEAMGETFRTRPEVLELRALIAKAQSLDRRPDRYEALLPVQKMDFDRVPVVR